MAPYDEIKPFSISVPNEQLEELRKKLELTRLPDELDLPPGQEWEWGIPLAILKPVVDYWRTQYDWRVVEERINRTLPQFTAYVESAKHGQQEVHFVHKRSNSPNALPLIFLHGWPGNFLEVSKIIEELINPKDSKRPSFHVVAPSLPGYVFSQRAGTPGMNVVGTAYILDKLMAKLGYKYYVAQGGDWGALVCQAFAAYHQDTCLAIHTNLAVSFPTLLRNPIIVIKTILGLYPRDELEGIKKTQQMEPAELGYQKIQGTRPQTLAVGLTGELIALLACWHGLVKSYTSGLIITHGLLKNGLLGLCFTGLMASPAGGLRYYKENSITGPPKDPELQTDLGRLVSLWSPTLHGFSWFPKELYLLPVEWSSIGKNQVYSKKHNKGGHFAAWEVPELLTNDIQNFVTIVLEKEPRLLGVV
ncbi:unnamed protein product [Rhizoctonia solani]|uniref:Epoxide hydrolase N-terminal domain-containing protein n=1 Tax=Rhizoctonia solani TaxID=456999 RepID=A0A8H3GW08_9AGAM|nr:unnamed protein product [Rhizoctonia solani]